MAWYIFWAHMTQIQFLLPQTLQSRIFCDFIILLDSSYDSGENVVLLSKIGARVMNSWLYTSFGRKEENKLPPITD